MNVVENRRAEALGRFWVALAAVLMIVAAIILALSFFIPYEGFRQQLVRAYGEIRTQRNFSPTVFRQLVVRLRYAAFFLASVGAALIGARSWLAAKIAPAFAALVLSFSHLRRRQFQPRLSVIAALLIITLIGFLVRLRFVDQPMRNDEAVTMMLYASKPAYLSISVYTLPNNHLFHTLLVHFAFKLFGGAPWAVRTPALLAGLLLIPLSYELARRFISQSAGLWTAALVSSSSVLVEYSTNARGYTMLACATATILIAGFETLRRASPAWFVVFGIAAFLGCWTVPVFLFPFGGTFLWMVWESFRGPRRFRSIYWLRLTITSIFAGAATVAAYVPPVAVSGFDSVFRNEWVGPHDFHTVMHDNLLRLGQTWQTWNRDLPFWWAWLAGMGFLFALLRSRRYSRMVACLAAWILFLLIARRLLPFDRTWLMLLPVFLTGVAALPAFVIDRFFQGSRRWGAVTVASIFATTILAYPVTTSNSVLRSSETGAVPGAQSVVRYLLSHRISPSTVFRDKDYDFPLQYYWWRSTGREAPLPPAKTTDESTKESWVLVNSNRGEDLSSSLQKFGMRHSEIVEKQLFDGLQLYRVERPHSG